MRILAIRGENLASLQAPFEIDLVEGPLEGAGLFAITGPTGAGKSTLLDALCLALYDNTPRLDLRQKSPPLIGDPGVEEKDKLRSTDPRSLLRRGAVQGWAEVDFSGVDGGRYTARWSVRRARSKPDGRIQGQELSLRILGEETPLVAGKKTEVRRAIEEKVGLDFDQFRRSVLLAQGDFAAFLKAEGEDRAELLERMTGTQVYQQLSRLAHEREKQEREARELLQARHGELSLLAPEELEALGESRDMAREARQERDQERQELARALEWVRRGETLEAASRAAQQALTEAQAAWEELAGERRERDLLEAAERLRAPLEERDRARARVQEDGEELARRDAALARTLEELEACQQRRREAEDECEATRSRETQAAEEIQQARKRDALLSSAEDREIHDRQNWEVAQGHLEVAEKERDRVRGQLEGARSRREACHQWLEEHVRVGALLETWTGISRDLERRAELLPRIAQEDEEGERLLGDLEAAEEAAREAGEARRLAEERVTRLKESAEKVQERVTALAPAGDVDPLDLLAGTRRSLEALEATLVDHRRLAKERVGLETERQEKVEAILGAQEREEQAEEEMLQLRPRLDEARRALDLFQRAQDLEERRGQLVPGEPCPLCGSPDHPWAQGEGVPTSQRARVEELETTLEDCSRRRREAAHQAETMRGRIEALTARIEEMQERLRQLEETWRSSDARAEAGLHADPTREGLGASLGERLEEVREEERTLVRLDRELRDLRGQLERAREERDVAQQEAIDRDKRVDEARLAREASRSQRETRAREHARLLESLGEVYPPEDLELDPEELRQRSATEVEEFRARRAELEELERTLQPLEGELGAQVAQVEQRGEEVRKTRSALEASQQDVERHRRKRAELLGGRSVEDFTAALREKIEEAEQARERANKAESLALQARKVAVVRQDEARTRSEEGKRLLEERELELSRALGQADLEEEELTALLARDPEEVRELRERVHQATRTLEEAREQEKLRTRDLAEHGSSEVPRRAGGARAEDLEEKLREVGEALQELDQALGKLQEKLDEDARARKRGVELLGELERQQERCSLWGKMKELIGSADGRKFRAFAQSLTLDCLLEQANHQLRDLAPRYRLQRVPGVAMELQVLDGDMGDEVRSVHSLSGGEGFLVSLALALGLSSLSSSRTRVESLFVDEGFGSLDATSLDRALDALQALQATGRQVGVISHVAGLAERIGFQVEVVRQGTGRSSVRTG